MLKRQLSQESLSVDADEIHDNIRKMMKTGDQFYGVQQEYDIEPSFFLNDLEAIAVRSFDSQHQAPMINRFKSSNCHFESQRNSMSVGLDSENNVSTDGQNDYQYS